MPVGFIFQGVPRLLLENFVLSLNGSPAHALTRGSSPKEKQMKLRSNSFKFLPVGWFLVNHCLSADRPWERIKHWAERLSVSFIILYRSAFDSWTSERVGNQSFFPSFLLPTVTFTVPKEITGRKTSLRSWMYLSRPVTLGIKDLTINRLQ